MKKGKLIISLIWLMLAFVGIVGATFAWFSENRNVDANGMQVQAETVKNLLISNAANGTYDFSATSAIAGTNAAKLTPVSSVPTLVNGAPKFYAPDNATRSSGINFSDGTLKSGAAFTEITPTTTTPAANTIYGVMKHSFWIQVNGQSAETLENLYASNIVVTRANPQSNITKALRIALVCGNNVYFYSITEGQTTYKGISAISDSDPRYTETQITVSDSFPNTNVLANTITVGTNYQVDVYIWYEGQDINCTSTNSLTIETLSVAITFSASDPE